MRKVCIALAGTAALVSGLAFGRSTEPALVDALATPLNERSLVFSASGDTAYFAVRSGDGYISVICNAVRIAGRWSTPEVVSFSGRYFDTDPSLSPDGRRLYFASNRPVAATGSAKRDLDIWVVARTPSGWSEPTRLPAPVNSPAVDASPAPAVDGTLYFASTRPGGAGSYDIYSARVARDTIYEVTNVGAPMVVHKRFGHTLRHAHRRA